jgi:hypothetical protein
MQVSLRSLHTCLSRPESFVLSYFVWQELHLFHFIDGYIIVLINKLYIPPGGR